MKKLFFIIIPLIFSAVLYSQEVNMVKIKGGAFKRGVENGKNNPFQIIRVEDFEISDKEITIGLYRQFLKEKFPGDSLLDDNYYVEHLIGVWSRNFKVPYNWPVFYSSFFQVCEFCNWLSEKENLEPVYDISKEYYDNGFPTLTLHYLSVSWDVTKNGYRLPTEAEWEYAASCGGLFSYENILDYAWIKENSDLKPHEVGTKKPNLFGLYDMLGNVAERCWDFYDENYYLKNDWNNPVEPSEGYYFDYSAERYNPGLVKTDRVVRGGSFYYREEKIYSRMPMPPTMQSLSVIGFRVAKNADTASRKVIGVGELNDDRVRLRKESGLNGEKIRLLQKGECVEILNVSQNKERIDGKEYPWIKIRTNKDEIGYVYGEYLNICSE